MEEIVQIMDHHSLAHVRLDIEVHAAKVIIIIIIISYLYRLKLVSATYIAGINQGPVNVCPLD
jgi:hypothetical protein